MKISTLAGLCVFGLGALGGAAVADEKIPITTASAEARELYLKGRDLTERLRATDARALFQQAAVKDPDLALAQVGLANTAGTAKEFFDAVGRAVALAGKASEGEQQIVCALDAGAKAEPARQKECLAKLTQAYPNDARAHNLMGAYYFGRQEWAASVGEFQKATELSPEFSQPYNQMGYAYRFMGKYPEAEQSFKKYIALIPDDPNPYDSYAELLMKMGRFEDSIKNYEKALSVDRNFVASYVGIGNDRVFMGQPDEARKAYARLTAIARNPGERRQALLWTAMSYVHEGATDKAIAELRKMADIDQAGKDLASLAAVHNQMGNVLLEAGRVDEAVAQYREQVATIDKADVPAQVKEGTHRQSLFDAARVALAKSDIAGAKAKAADYATAVAAGKRPFEVRQSHELAGRIALAEKNYKLAVTELRQANDQDPRVLYLTALALQGAGEAQKAKEVGAQAADFNGLSATYGYVRGKARAMITAPKRD